MCEYIKLVYSMFERITRFDEYFEYTFWDDTSVESEN